VINNQEIGIEIINYEYPPTSFGYNNTEHDGSDDWIYVKINIKSDFGNYEHTSPIFQIFEIENLINWLDRLSKNKPVKNVCVTTIEDYFLFELLNKYNDKEKRIKISFKEEKGSYVEFVANNKILHKYSKELLSELNFLHDTYKSIKKLYKILQKEIKNNKYDKIIAKDKTVKIKENFKEGYRDEKGYKIIYSKSYRKDLTNDNIVVIIPEMVEIVEIPFRYNTKWDEFFKYNGIRYKIIDKYIIFYSAVRYESIKFIRIIKNNKYYNNYLIYNFEDLSLEEQGK
jgi:hypothetical protein